MKTSTRIAISVFCCLFIAISASASNRKITEINASVKTADNKIRGPRTIKLTHVNTLRYDVAVNGTAKYTAGLNPTDLKGIIPNLPSSTPAAAKPAATTPPAGGESGSSVSQSTRTNLDDLTKTFTDILGDLEDYETDWATLQNRINASIDLVNAVQAETETFVRGTDNTINQDNGPEIIAGQIAGIVNRIDQAINRSYDQDPTARPPSIDIATLLARLDQLRTQLETFRVKHPAEWPAWIAANKDAYDRVLTRIGELQTAIRAVNRDSASAKAFLEHQNWLRNWRVQLQGITRDSFSLPPFDVDCSFAFSNNKETKIELSKRDRLGAQDAEPAKQEIVTVVCSAPLSISAGFGFSTVEEKDFMFVQSTKTVTDDMGKTSDKVINVFGFKNRSTFRALPVLLLNTRFWEPNDTFSIHASAGAVVDVNTGEAGTDVEYVVGPSLAFWRTFFVTAGLHIGRVPEIAGGFQLGKEVPSGVNTTPIEKSWKKGFAVTFTYRIK